MFQGTKPFGLDSISLNIERGCDDGLRTYSDYLQLTSFKLVETFSDFGNEVLYKQCFANYPCLIFFSIIISQTGQKLSRVDKHPQENGPVDNPGYITSAQLNVIRQQSTTRSVSTRIFAC
jgi:hypothetical protein